MSIEIKKTRDGKVYRVRWIANGQRMCRTFKRFYDAKQFEREAEESCFNLDAGNYTFHKAADEWLTKYAEVRKASSSVYVDRNMLKQNIFPYIGTMRLHNIQPRHLENWIYHLKQKKGVSHSTINRNLDVIRAIFNYYYRRRAIFYNPVSAIERLKVDTKPFAFWNREEISKFLEYARKKYEGMPQHATYLFYLLALNTGARQGELLALKWPDVDFEQRLITISKTFSNHTREIKNTTKSHKVRHVPINSALFQPLYEAYTRCKSSELVLTWKGSIIDPNNLRQRCFWKDVQESGVRRIRIHDMRHTFASHFMMNGGNPYALQVILGHSSLKMTERYTHFSKTFLLDKTDVVNFSAEGNVIKVDFPQVATA